MLIGGGWRGSCAGRRWRSIRRRGCWCRCRCCTPARSRRRISARCTGSPRAVPAASTAGTAQALLSTFTAAAWRWSGAMLTVAGRSFAAFWRRKRLSGDGGVSAADVALARRWALHAVTVSEPRRERHRSIARTAQPHSAGAGGAIMPLAMASPGARSRASSRGPSRSTQSASGATSSAGAIDSEVATMQPTMMLEAERARRLGHVQRVGQAAGLVELDVDGVVAVARARRARRRCGRIRRRRRARGGRMRGERLVGAGGQRLLDRLEADLGCDGEQAVEIGRRPSLRWRRRRGGHRAGRGGRRACARRRRRHRRGAELQLEQRQVRHARGLGGHLVGSGEADRVAGQERTRRRERRRAARRGGRSLGLEIPQRAVERVAGGARRHRASAARRGRVDVGAERLRCSPASPRASRRSGDRARIRRGRCGCRR